MSMKKTTELKFDDRVTEFKNNLYEKSLEIIKEVIPKRITEFQKLSAQYSLGDFTADENNHSDENVEKKRKFEGESPIPSIEELSKPNSTLIKTQKILRNHYIEIVQTLSVVRNWIQLNIPKIEDGNNFGVDIQEEIVNYLTKIEDAYTSILEQSDNYYFNRATAIKKALKHPNIESFRYGIIQCDEKEKIRIRLAFSDLAYNYATAYSNIVKNFQKLETPRPQSASSINIY